MSALTYYRDIDPATIDRDTLEALDAVVEAFRSPRTGLETRAYRPDTSRARALRRVSRQALDAVLRADVNVLNAREDSNMLMLSEADVEIPGRRLCAVLPARVRRFAVSGLILYPRQGFMGWHTNSNHQAYGHRAYFAHVDQGRRSFFRYRHPRTGEVVTSWDRAGWNVRLFRVDGAPLWHCVYAATQRCSIGLALALHAATAGGPATRRPRRAPA